MKCARYVTTKFEIKGTPFTHRGPACPQHREVNKAGAGLGPRVGQSEFIRLN